MAKDLDGVNDGVEKLLGLKYEDFVECVVLPQGQFAALPARQAKRTAGHPAAPCSAPSTTG